jgi:cytidine deaminase
MKSPRKLLFGHVDTVIRRIAPSPILSPNATTIAGPRPLQTHPLRRSLRFMQEPESGMDLVTAAAGVRQRAYAPYSGFAVGAALRAVSGSVHLGCNVENAAYPEGTCAEAGAIAAMIAAGDTAIAEIAVIADSPRPVPPCGGCRQKLAEFATADTPVTLATLSGARQHTTVGALLPGAFRPTDMPGR